MTEYWTCPRCEVTMEDLLKPSANGKCPFCFWDASGRQNYYFYNKSRCVNCGAYKENIFDGIIICACCGHKKTKALK